MPTTYKNIFDSNAINNTLLLKYTPLQKNIRVMGKDIFTVIVFVRYQVNQTIITFKFNITTL